VHLGIASLANLHLTASMALVWALSELTLRAAEPPIVTPPFPMSRAEESRRGRIGLND
jgi:hypothetical protein